MDTSQGIAEELRMQFGASELKCQYDHTNNITPERFRECRVSVTHIVQSSCGREQVHLCENAALTVEIVMAAKGHAVCKTCMVPPHKHWSLRPI